MLAISARIVVVPSGVYCIPTCIPDADADGVGQGGPSESEQQGGNYEQHFFHTVSPDTVSGRWYYGLVERVNN
jgi:hypothetical protein